jgi:hypothetical protein
MKNQQVKNYYLQTTKLKQSNHVKQIKKDNLSNTAMDLKKKKSKANYVMTKNKEPRGEGEWRHPVLDSH